MRFKFTLGFIVIFVVFTVLYLLNVFLFKESSKEKILKINKNFIFYKLEGRKLKLLVADEPKEWEQGLMFVKKFDLDCEGSQKFTTENNVSLDLFFEATDLGSQFGSLDAPIWPSLTLRLKHSPTAYPNLARRDHEPSTEMSKEKQNVRISSRESSQEFATNKKLCNKQYSFDGMIFLFPDKQIRYFWNKNTFVDLEVYWLDDDKIVSKDLLPSIEKTKEIYTIKSPQPVNKVIEVIIK